MSMATSPTKTPPPDDNQPTPTPTPTPTPDPADQAQGDGLGPPDATTAALQAAADQSDLTDRSTASDQLMCAALSDDLSAGYSAAPGGWCSANQDIDPYTNTTASGTDNLSTYTGQPVDAYTNVASTPDTASRNAFTGGQNVEPMTGEQNVNWFGGSQNSSLASPNPLASNSPVGSNDAPPTPTAYSSGQPFVLPDGQTITLPPDVGLPGQNVQINATTKDGTTYVRIIVQTDGGWVIHDLTQPATGSAGVQWLELNPAAATTPAASTATPGAPTTTPSAPTATPAGGVSSTQVPSTAAPTSAAPAIGPQPDRATTNLTPDQLNQLANFYHLQSLTPYDPSAATNQVPPPAPAPPVASPPSDSWFSSTIIGDVLAAIAGLFSPSSVGPSFRPRSPADLPPGLQQLGQLNASLAQQSLQDASVRTRGAIAAAGVPYAATLGALSAPAVGALASDASLAVASRFPSATIAALDVGNALTGTTLPRVVLGSAVGVAAGGGALGGPAIASKAAEELPTLASQELPALGTEIEPSVQSTAEQAAARFQDIVRQAEAFLRDNPDLVLQLGGSSRGAPISSNQLGAAIGQYAQGNPAFARALSGNALEAIVNAIIEDAPPGAGSFLQVSGPGRIDFIGTGAFAGYTFELTTEAGVAGHALRAYMQVPGSMIFTYLPIIQ